MQGSVRSILESPVEISQWPVPDAWFSKPSREELASAGYFHAETSGPEAGRVYGSWVPDLGACHVGYRGSCKQAPTDVDVSEFLSQTLQTSGGRASVGLLSIGLGHNEGSGKSAAQIYGALPDGVSSASSAEELAAELARHEDGLAFAWDQAGDPTSRALAIVNVGIADGRCWFAGILSPLVPLGVVALATASRLSGDWVWWASNRKPVLQGICSVVRAGFGSKGRGAPIQRVAASGDVALGEVFAEFSSWHDKEIDMACNGNCQCKSGASAAATAEPAPQAGAVPTAGAVPEFVKNHRFAAIGDDSRSAVASVSTAPASSVTVGSLKASAEDFVDFSGDEPLLTCTFNEGPTDDGRLFAVGGCEWRDALGMVVGYDQVSAGHYGASPIAKVIGVERVGESEVRLYARYVHNIDPTIEGLSASLSRSVEKMVTAGILCKSSMRFTFERTDITFVYRNGAYEEDEDGTVRYSPGEDTLEIERYKIIGCDVVAHPAIEGNGAFNVSSTTGDPVVAGSTSEDGSDPAPDEGNTSAAPADEGGTTAMASDSDGAASGAPDVAASEASDIDGGAQAAAEDAPTGDGAGGDNGAGAGVDSGTATDQANGDDEIAVLLGLLDLDLTT